MMGFRQIEDEEWNKGDYIPVAIIRHSSAKYSAQFGIEFREVWEAGLGPAKWAGFKTEGGKQFALIEYAYHPDPPAINLLSLNEPSTMAIDLMAIIEALELSLTDLAWIHPQIASKDTKS